MITCTRNEGMKVLLQIMKQKF